MEIYADVLFFINLVSTYVIVDLTGRIIKNKPKLSRKIISAIIGAFLSVIAFCSDNISGFLRIINAVAVPVTAFGYRRYETHIEVIIFSLMSFIVSGIFAFIVSINNSGVVEIKNGILYFDIPGLKFIIFFALAYLVILICDNLLKRRKIYIKHTITISHNGKSAIVTALSDSGNLLKEPITGKDVIVCEWESIKGLFNDISYEEFINKIDEHKLWLVPYSSLGNKDATIFAFLADNISIAEKKKCIGKAFVAVTNEKLTSSNEYNALTGASL